MIPLNVIFGNESYQEEVEIKVDQFYEEVKNKKELPSTSQPAIGEFVKLQRHQWNLSGRCGSWRYGGRY
jgi:fatty acid-binding protein DegV